MHPTGPVALVHSGGRVNHSPHDRPPSPWADPWPQTPGEFGALVDAFGDRLVRYAFRQLGNLDDAEDVVQEVLVRAFADRRKRAGITAVGPYLYRSVANACTDLLRKRNRAAVYREEIEAELLLGLAADPAEAAQAAESLRRAERLLGQLPPEQAEVVRLRVFDGLRLAEIAELVDCTVNTVCSRLRYAFQKLRGLVAAERE